MDRVKDTFPWVLAVALACAAATAFIVLAHALQDWHLTMG